MSSLLHVEELKVYYKSVWGDYKAVDGVTFDVFEKEIFSIAGESGCGKSTLAEGILRLVKPPGFIAGGQVIFNNVDLLKLSEEELRKIRWTKLAYIPQGSMNSLNPVLKIKEQMVDAIVDHCPEMEQEEAEELAYSMLSEVGLPVDVAEMYPHQLSGGMKQRVIIATALALKPQLVVADEPTTALDVVVQRGILQLIKMLKEKYDMTVIFISHDMAAHAQIADRIAIMYAGKIVEIGSIEKVFEEPLHPYTRGLIDSIPTIGRRNIKGIPGVAPSPLNWPTGCRFHPRCIFATEACSKIEPPLEELENGRYVACHLYR